MAPEPLNEQLAATINLIDEIQALRGSADKLLELLEPIGKNSTGIRFDVHVVLTRQGSEDVPETVCCSHCERSFRDGVMQALDAGWMDIRRVSDGDKGYVSGWCPDCQAAYEEEDFQRHYRQLPEAVRAQREDVRPNSLER